MPDWVGYIASVLTTLGVGWVGWKARGWYEQAREEQAKRAQIERDRDAERYRAEHPVPDDGTGAFRVRVRDQSESE